MHRPGSVGRVGRGNAQEGLRRPQGSLAGHTGEGGGLGAVRRRGNRSRKSRKQTHVIPSVGTGELATHPEVGEETLADGAED